MPAAAGSRLRQRPALTALRTRPLPNPPPRCGGGGWKRRWGRIQSKSRRGRVDGCSAVARAVARAVAPSPACGGGLGRAQVRSGVAARCANAWNFQARIIQSPGGCPGFCPLPCLRGRAGVGAGSERRSGALRKCLERDEIQMPAPTGPRLRQRPALTALRTRPLPNPPPRCGGGGWKRHWGGIQSKSRRGRVDGCSAVARPSLGCCSGCCSPVAPAVARAVAPSPACGGGLGWGQVRSGVAGRCANAWNLQARNIQSPGGCPGFCPLPRLRGRAGVGAGSERRSGALRKGLERGRIQIPAATGRVTARCADAGNKTRFKRSRAAGSPHLPAVGHNPQRWPISGNPLTSHQRLASLSQRHSWRSITPRSTWVWRLTSLSSTVCWTSSGLGCCLERTL
jgi:hypothetical protein